MSILGSEYDGLTDAGKHTMLLGAFSQVAAYLDHFVEIVLVSLLGTSHRYGGAVIRHINLGAQRDLIRLIMADKYGTDSSEYNMLNDILGAIKEGIDNRNKYLHSLHLYTEQGISSQSFKRGKFDFDARISNLAEMEKNLHKAMLAGELLLKFLAQQSDIQVPNDQAPLHKEFLEAESQNHSQNHTGQESTDLPESSQD
tara:strand:- start:1545 stop:2141 length:597 start_codon:yes stop_codon:yes gene_type:complete